MKRLIVRPPDVAPRRPCRHCGGQQALRNSCGGGQLWLCQNLKCRHRDVIVDGDCPRKPA
jgi:hypothetical protein